MFRKSQHIQKTTRLPIVFIIMLATAGVAFAIGTVNPNTSDTDYTNTDVMLLVAYILLALVFSFLCSVAEAVLLSITPSYIEGLNEGKPKLAALLKRLKQENVDQSLAAILTLNTIAHTVGAIGSGAKATIVFGNTWFGLFSAVMTLMILFLSEIIPKTIGAIFWRNLTWATALFVRTLIIILYPLIKVSEALTRVIAGKKDVHVFSRDEFIAMARIGEKSGQIDEDESRIIRNLFRLKSIMAEHVMTPRTVILAFQQNVTVAEILETSAKSPFSRLPIFGTDMDDMIGFILRDDLLLANAQNKGETPLVQLKRDMMTVAGDLSLSELLEFLLEQRQHIVRVVDSYGGTKGIVTLEDVVETLLGMEIVDEMDRVEDMQNMARELWVKRAKGLGLSVEEG